MRQNLHIPWLGQIGFAKQGSHCDVAGVTHAHLLHFFFLTSVKNTHMAAHLTPFEIKRLLWLFFTCTLLHQVFENHYKLRVETYGNCARRRPATSAGTKDMTSI